MIFQKFLVMEQERAVAFAAALFLLYNNVYSYFTFTSISPVSVVISQISSAAIRGTSTSPVSVSVKKVFSESTVPSTSPVSVLIVMYAASKPSNVTSPVSVVISPRSDASVFFSLTSPVLLSARNVAHCVPVSLMSPVLLFTEIAPSIVAAVTVASPVAVSSVPMAQESGADAALAGQLVVWTTMLSAFTLFGFIFVLRLLGIFV